MLRIIRFCLLLLTGFCSASDRVIYPIHDAIRRGEQPETFTKSDLDSQDADGNTPLHIAVMKDNVAVVQGLLACGADQTKKKKCSEYDFKIPLDIAFEALNYDMGALSCEVQNSIFLNRQDPKKIAIIKALLVASTLPNFTKSSTPLMMAAHLGLEDVVATLLQAGRNPNENLGGIASPMFEAACYGHIPVMELLKKAGAIIDGKLFHNVCFKIQFCFKGLQQLLDWGCDVDARQSILKKDVTPSWAALGRNQYAKIDFLLRSGAVIDQHVLEQIARCQDDMAYVLAWLWYQTEQQEKQDDAMVVDCSKCAMRQKQTILENKKKIDGLFESLKDKQTVYAAACAHVMAMRKVI